MKNSKFISYVIFGWYFFGIYSIVKFAIEASVKVYLSSVAVSSIDPSSSIPFATEIDVPSGISNWPIFFLANGVFIFLFVVDYLIGLKKIKKSVDSYILPVVGGVLAVVSVAILISVNIFEYPGIGKRILQMQRLGGQIPVYFHHEVKKPIPEKVIQRIQRGESTYLESVLYFEDRQNDMYYLGTLDSTERVFKVPKDSVWRVWFSKE